MAEQRADLGEIPLPVGKLPRPGILCQRATLAFRAQRLLGGRSVAVPSETSAAKATVSESVG